MARTDRKLDFCMRAMLALANVCLKDVRLIRVFLMIARAFWVVAVRLLRFSRCCWEIEMQLLGQFVAVPFFSVSGIFFTHFFRLIAFLCNFFLPILSFVVKKLLSSRQ